MFTQLITAMDPVNLEEFLDIESIRGSKTKRLNVKGRVLVTMQLHVPQSEKRTMWDADSTDHIALQAT